MKKSPLLLALFCFTIGYSFSFQDDSLEVKTKNGISKPSILSTHPFGIFFSRLQGNFKTHAPEKTVITIGSESGNVWGTQIKTYIPNDDIIRDQVRLHEWHQAQYFFEEETLDAESYELQIDGVIKGFRLNTSFKLASNQELNIGLRMFTMSKGKFPFTLFTSDNFIETFHKNVAGGTDPFDRGVFGHNQAMIKYTDRNGNNLELKNASFILGGIETSYFYYPKWWHNQRFYTNFGVHVGTNLSKYNSSIDFGITTNIIKTFNINKRSYIQLATGFGLLRKNLINFKSENIDFGTNSFLGNMENAIEYNFISKGKTTHSIGLDHYIQTSLNKSDEVNYIIPIRHENAHKAWGHGITNLYKKNKYWTLFYSFGRKVTKTFYIQQDFEVNNNPDFQSGIAISFNLR